MPGSKRKCDEDTWISTQSKKFKCGQLMANVYASTLAQLRMGARKVFNSGISHHNSPTDQHQGNQSPGSSSAFHSPPSSPPASPLMRDLLSDDDMNPPSLQAQLPLEICSNCRSKREGWEKCYYCEKVVCHLHNCQDCQKGYCSNCCITKYDNPSGDTYSCYSCLH
ncbi:uncharacterized protein LOC110844802 [Folsomia candida]|uniref:uncharacterized protein LOC110844802 n=1 Tax=Folsomia candida TaxID=158441 RepID=UPI000B8F8424|nr:uncharacterized protein LOC110844802 [Folsomia candida]